MGAIEVLKWDPAPRVFAFRYPNCQLNYKSQLIVSEAQEAVLVKEGVYYGPIEPGRHTIETKNFARNAGHKAEKRYDIQSESDMPEAKD